MSSTFSVIGSNSTENFGGKNAICVTKYYVYILDKNVLIMSQYKDWEGVVPSALSLGNTNPHSILQVKLRKNHYNNNAEKDPVARQVNFR
jgi:hypothetical protein